MSPDTSPFAVDASVGVKWVLDEDLTEHAQALLHTSPPRRIIAPPHLISEVTNAIFQRMRTTDPTKHVDPDDGEEALNRFLRFRIDLISSPPLYQRAVVLARTHRLPNIYDSLYVALAELSGCELWTADAALLRALGGGAPWVRWIGDYPLG